MTETLVKSRTKNSRQIKRTFKEVFTFHFYFMRPVWKGAISFGLVSIPIVLYPATRREELKFRLLRKSDLSPVNYKRVAEADGKEVPWENIVKGYEYEKGRYVVIKDEDFARVDVEA